MIIFIKNKFLLSITAIILLTVVNNESIFAQSITKIEPPNWWNNMANDTVQLMVYGKDLKNATVICSNNEAKIVGVFAQDADYAFVDIVFAKNIKPQDLELVFSVKKKTISFKYTILQNDYFKPQGFNESDLVYLIMPDRFCNGDTSNDNVPEMEQSNTKKIDGRQGGDMQGITQQLPYIKALGVTSIWLTPFLEMNDKQGSYHGYGTSNFYEADARYTSGKRHNETNNIMMCDYVKAVHNSKMKVIMDVVLNHIGAGHEWQSHTPRIADWLHDSIICNFQMPTITDPYATTSDKNKMEKGWFVPSMPDLNQSNARMGDYLIQNNIWWVQTAKIDALRLDTAPFSDKHFLTKWANALHLQYPTLSLVGEVWSIVNQPASTKYFQASTTNKDGYNSAIPSVMDLPLWEAMLQGLQQNDATKPYYCLTQDYLYEHPKSNFILLGNHDTERFYTSIGNNYAKYEMALIWLATMRGIPQIYYGDELCMTGKKGINDGYMRETMPGFNKQNPKNIFSKKGMNDADTAAMALNFNTKLWNWRKTNMLASTGELMHYYPANGIYAYKKYWTTKKEATETLLVLLNFTNEAKEIDWKLYKEILDDDKNYAPIFNANGNSKFINTKTKFILKPHGYLVINGTK